MLRRDFFKVVAGFVAASAAAKTAAAAAGLPESAAVCKTGLPLPPEVAAAVESRSVFERQLIECLRDGSLYCLGITSRDGYSVMYRIAKHIGETSPDERKAATVLWMYDRGIVGIERVDVYNDWAGIKVEFGICGVSA